MVGHVTVARRYYRCRACGAAAVPLDGWAGLGARHLTGGARRLVALAGASWPFDRASRHLREFCRLDVSDDTIERVCQEAGERARRWLDGSPAAAGPVARAAGRPEFSTDGVTVNTVGGWRELRLSVLARREPAGPCEPAGWAGRALNAPTARLAWCAIAGCGRVGASWRRAGDRAGLGGTADAGLSVIADGARWIWDQAAKRFRCPAEWCVDVYHVSQHLHACGRALRGEGAAARAWADERLGHLLEHQGPGLIRRLGEERAAAGDAAGRAAIDALLGYLRDNADSMWYRDRLRDGLPIGSGLIEGACRNAIAARLKANAARWRVRRVERVGALRCLDYSDLWDAFWQSEAA